MPNKLNVPKIGVLFLFATAVAFIWNGSRSTGVVPVEDKILMAETEPIALSGHTHVPGVDTEYEHSLFAYDAMEMKEDFWIESFASEVIGAPDEVVHHGELMLQGKPDHQCQSSPDGTVQTEEPLWFVSNFNRNKNFTFPKPLGIFLAKGTKLKLAGMFHNPYRDYTDVRLRLTIQGKSGVRPDAEHRPIRYYRIMSEECVRGNTFTVPPHTENFVKSKVGGPFAFNESGTIFMLYPHFHFWAGGKFQSVSLNGEAVWKFYAPDPGSVFFRPDPSNPSQVSVAKGDKLDFEAVYDNAADIANPDAMAAVTFFLAPDAYENSPRAGP